MGPSPPHTGPAFPTLSGFALGSPWCRSSHVQRSRQHSQHQERTEVEKPSSPAGKREAGLRQLQLLGV